MSKHQYMKHISKELKKINEIIDFKILHGLNYKEETKRHKDLLGQISMFKPKRSFNLFSMFF